MAIRSRMGAMMDPCVHAPTRPSSSSTGVDLVNRVRLLGRDVSFADQSRERDLKRMTGTRKLLSFV